MNDTNWSTPADVRSIVRRRWERGHLLAEVAVPTERFPFRVALKRPTTAEIGSKFEAVRQWAADLGTVAHGRVEVRSINHRQIGANSVPVAIWFDTVDAAAGLLGKSRELERFRALVATTERRHPELVQLLAASPHDCLAEIDAWPTLLDIVDWVRLHPRPGIYLRQVDIAGVHTKFIEQHTRLLAEMLDRILPQSAVDTNASKSDFIRRYGFRTRPRTIRFRSLDPTLRVVRTSIDHQYSLTAADFGLVEPPARVFVTENEINFLAFPNSPGAIVVFGAGSGFDHFALVSWLADVPVHYWGDIDTHGMAILDQLRGFVPHATSLMMDSDTLLAHRSFWGIENTPVRRDLPRLTDSERAVYDDLRDNRLQSNLRLEQERIRFGWVRACVEAATVVGPPT